jgi:pSer/pThr/pTyr-binding forkhead associated (FHA) protein
VGDVRTALPRLIVEVRWGKLAGTKASIEPGRRLRVGRTELADLTIPHDGRLSGVHFELTWDGQTPKIRDLESQTGTRLGGELVKEAAAPHGSWIEAGDTHFVIYIEGRTPPPDELDEEDEAALGEDERRLRRERQRAADAARDALRALSAKSPLYAVLDSARSGRILQIVRESVEPHQSLYEGTEGETFEDVAPYLVGPMRADSTLLDRLVSEGWGSRWCIFCICREPFRAVRTHFRRFLMVELEQPYKRVYFRFYDPKVLQTLWPAFTPAQREHLMGNLEGLYIERPSGGDVVLASVSEL